MSGQLEDQLIPAAPPCCGVSTFENALQCGSKVRINSNSFSPTDGVIFPITGARGVATKNRRYNIQCSANPCGLLPRFVGIRLAHGLNRLRRVRAQVFFIDDAVMIDDERHHSRGTVLRGGSDHGEAAHHFAAHMGQITREDESTFSSEQLDELLSCLHYFLSFALGRWAGVALPVGFDAAGNKAFEEWGLRITADGPWHGGSSWFDSHHSELLSQLFPWFMKLWTNKLWQKPLRDALYWYVASCDRRVGIGVDAGLILAQTALELLAWTYCVLDRKMISAAAFQPRRLSAADKLRLLASSLNIPLEIPPHLSALHGRRGKKWIDGMEAITDVRNSLVHPAAHQNLLNFSYFEAWKLSLWYIDLVLLRLCGHSGKYANRLYQRWTGQVESVPWAQSSI